MRDLVFLFGAGAAYGAGDIVPERPPLGAELYSRLASHYTGTWGNLPSAVRTAFSTGNFERGMGNLYEGYSMAVAPLMLQMAVYLIQYRPFSGKSLYCRLIHELVAAQHIERTVFSTLNYDCILEFAMLRQGVPLSYFNGGDAVVPVWKLHGSCNWFSHGVQAGSGVTYMKGVTWEGGIEASLDIGTVVQKCVVNQGLAPVMALYMQGKPLQVSPSSVQKIQERWQEAVSNAVKVICIGVRPWPADTHIWQPLAQTAAEVLFIGDQREFDDWRASYREGSSVYLAPYFHTGFARLIARL